MITGSQEARATLSRSSSRSSIERLARGWRQLLTPWGLVVGAAVVIVGYLALVPLYFLLRQTFVGPGGVTLGGFARAYGGDTQAGQMLINSLVFAIGSTAVAILVGTVLAYVQVRTDAPFKGLLFVVSIGPLIIPAFLYSAAWIFLADPKIGIINSLVPNHLLAGGVDVYSMGGMIWSQGLHSAPLAFLLMVAAFRSMDPALEESALANGSPRWAMLRRITIPLMRPAIAAAVLILFVHSVEAFEVPSLLGIPGGIYVFTSRIYLAMRTFPVDYGVVGSYAVTLLAIAVVGVLIAGLLSRNARKYQTITGKAFRPRAMKLGRARPAVGAGLVLYFAVTLALPLVALVYASLLPYYQAPSVAVLRSLSLANYQAVAEMPSALSALKNSVILSVSAATAVMLLSAIAAWVVVRTRVPGRRILDVLTFTPLVIPGIVLGLALLSVYVRVPLAIYGTLLILIIAYTTRFLPYAMRYANVAMVQTSGELEDSGLVCGASRWQVFRRILLPLSSSGLIAGWIFVLIISFRELSATILLYNPKNTVVSVLIFEQLQIGEYTIVAAMGIVMVAILVILSLGTYLLGGRVGVETQVDR